MLRETWEPIAGFTDHYECSNLGRIRRTTPGKSTKPGRLLKQCPHHPTGRRQTMLCVGGKRHLRYVAELIASTFLGPRPEGHQLKHLNGDVADCRAANLKWAFGKFRLTKDQIVRLRERTCMSTEPIEKILADHPGMTHPYLLHLVSKEHPIPGGPRRILPRRHNPRRKLTNKDVLELRMKHRDGTTGRDLATEYGVSESCISRICSGERRAA